MRMLSFEGLTNAETKDRTREIELLTRRNKAHNGKDQKRHILMSYAKGCKNEEV